MSNRSRLLVDPQVQWPIAARIASHWGMSLICLLTIGMMVSVLTHVGQMQLGELMKQALKSQLLPMAVMILMIPWFIRDTLRLSNRFAGPMYRLRIGLQKMSDNELPAPIKFRTGDFWQEAADDFNTVRSQFESLHLENVALKAEIESIRNEQIAV